jgi:hypothetical protein
MDAEHAAPADRYVISPGIGQTDSAMPTLHAAVTATIAGANALVTYSGSLAGACWECSRWT